MKEKEWKRLLTEKYITMLNLPGDDSRTFIPCRAETASPTTDWEASWANCRQPGMSPELASFLWMMIHNLLSTQERLSRMGAVATAQCKMQGCVEDGSLQHELLHCSKNDGVGNLLVSCLQTIVPDIQPAAILRLEFGDLGEEITLAVTWVTAIVLKHIWKERDAGSTIHPYKVRADLEQYINLLRTTRFDDAVNHLNDLKAKMFH